MSHKSGGKDKGLIKAEDGRLKPCYLVVQPVKWCSEQKHITESIVGWRQCDHHCHQDNKFALCGPSEREMNPFVLAYSYSGYPKYVMPPDQCQTCRDMEKDQYFTARRKIWQDYQDQLKSDDLTPAARAELVALKRDAHERLGILVQDFKHTNLKQQEEMTRRLIQSNPVMRIFKGGVRSNEPEIRPQAARIDPASVVEIVTIEEKKMRDEGE